MTPRGEPPAAGAPDAGALDAGPPEAGALDARWWPPGAGLATELRRVLRLADPVPGPWRDAAALGFAWVEIAAAPGRLAYDAHFRRGGQADPAAPVAGERREARYVAGPVSVALEVQADAGTVQLSGRIEPPRRVEVAVLWPGGRWDGASDEDGVFGAGELPRRPLCVVLGGPDPVKTGWVAT